MVSIRQERVKKLEEAFARVGFPSGSHGSVPDKAKLVGANVRTLRAWLDGSRPPPNMIFVVLEAFRRMDDSQRMALREWANQCADQGDYAPQD